MPESAGSIRSQLLEWGRWSTLLFLFAVPINKPLTNLALFFALVCSLAGVELSRRFAAALRQPVAIGAGIWFTVLLLSAMHSSSWHQLGAYKALLYPLLLATLLDSDEWRERGLFAFGLATTLVLGISWLQFLGIVPQREIAMAMESYKYTVFKEYTQQGIEFLALAAMAASFSTRAPKVEHKYALWLIALAAFANVMLLLQSRTSYLIAAPLIFYWVFVRFRGTSRIKNIAFAGFAALAMCSAALLSPHVQQRITQAQQELALYSTEGKATSLGIRMDLWRRTLPIIASAPLIGHGLGQWTSEYRRNVSMMENHNEFIMGHPHQEALLILSEEGILGFSIFVSLLILLRRYIGHLDRPNREFYTSLLLIYVTAGLANCLLVDFSHRHLFLGLLACVPLPVTKPSQGISRKSL